MTTVNRRICSLCGRDFDDSVDRCPYDEHPLDPADPEVYVGKTLDRRYLVEEVLGSGGMGAVYRARHVDLNRPVAVKILKPSLVADQVAVRRFRREAEALGLIAHPHAVAVTDFGITEEGAPYLVMEHLHGSTLRQVIRKSGELELARTARILRHVCGAIAAAHRVGVIHRDIKPDNIMLVADETSEIAKVLDFGIAKLVTPERQQSRLTAGDSVVGTPRYMSPEACEGRDLTTATDVYSLGVVLYEMLVGFPPFNGDSPVDIALQHVGAPPLPPSKLRPELPPAAEAAVMRALSKQPADRQPTALQLAAEFEAAIGGADQSQTGEGGMKQANLAYVLVGLLLLLALVLGAWATFGSDG